MSQEKNKDLEITFDVITGLAWSAIVFSACIKVLFFL
jgi:hypothetical protein